MGVGQSSWLCCDLGGGCRLLWVTIVHLFGLFLLAKVGLLIYVSGLIVDVVI